MSKLLILFMLILPLFSKEPDFGKYGYIGFEQFSKNSFWNVCR